MQSPVTPRLERQDEPPLELGVSPLGAARYAIAQRLTEVVTWPESRIPAHERHLAADILLDLLRTSGIELRQRCAQGLVLIHDAPKALLRYLARDEIQVARPLLQAGVGFDESDLISTIRAGIDAHWLEIASRRNIGTAVTDALMQTGDVAVMEAALRNQTSKMSSFGIDMAVSRSRQSPSLPPLLAARSELHPSQALVLFWWSEFHERMQILRRFAVDRNVLIQELGDVFAVAAAEGWQDADARKTLQVVERRQRNRGAATKSPYGSLEGAITAAEKGLDPALINEIAHLSGVKPTTAAQIFSDPGGEAIGVLCKATGLKRPMLLTLWRALRRPIGETEEPTSPLGRTLYVFDTLATAKAQTVLRYWNWSFTADAVGVQDVSFENDRDLSTARRNASLLFNLNG